MQSHAAFGKLSFMGTRTMCVREFTRARSQRKPLKNLKRIKKCQTVAKQSKKANEHAAAKVKIIFIADSRSVWKKKQRCTHYRCDF